MRRITVTDEFLSDKAAASSRIERQVTGSSLIVTDSRGKILYSGRPQEARPVLEAMGLWPLPGSEGKAPHE